MDKNKILIIDDEKDIVEAIEYNLIKEGFKISKAHDGINGLRLAREKSPDLIVLDLMLPGISGTDICRNLKNDPKTASIPIIMLTAKTGELDRVLGLELGADDYVTKPFSVRELMARIKTILRRYGIKKKLQKPSIKVPGMEIDAERHEVKVNGKAVELTAKEFALLKFLVENNGRVFSREELLDSIWRIESAVETRTVDVHIRRLRQKLSKIGKKIITLRGVGYKFNV